MAKKNQHYVPRGFLSHFTIDGDPSHVWQYDKEGGTLSRFPKSIRRICSRNRYYAQKTPDNKLDDTSVENALAEVESLVIPIIRQLKPLSGSNKITIAELHRGYLAFFIGLLFSRGPSFRDGVHELHEQIVKSTHEQMEKQGEFEEMPERLKALIDEKGLWEVLKVKIDPHVSLEPMVMGAQQLGLSLVQKVWRFATPADGMFFVTSDSPVAFRFAQQPESSQQISIGPGHPQSEVTVSLRRDLALICRPTSDLTRSEFLRQDRMTVPMDEEDTRQVNALTSRAAMRYVYAPKRSDALLESIKSMGSGTPRWRVLRLFLGG